METKQVIHSKEGAWSVDDFTASFELAASALTSYKTAWPNTVNCGFNDQFVDTILSLPSDGDLQVSLNKFLLKIYPNEEINKALIYRWLKTTLNLATMLAYNAPYSLYTLVSEDASVPLMELIEEINRCPMLALDSLLKSKKLSHFIELHPLYPVLQLFTAVSQDRYRAYKKATRYCREKLISGHPEALNTLLSLCHYMLNVGKLERSTINTLLNPNARCILVSVLIKSQTQLKELWKIIQACAQLAVEQGVSAINGFDVWRYCREHDFSINEQKIKSASQGLEAGSLLYECLQLFRRSNIVKSVIPENDTGLDAMRYLLGMPEDILQYITQFESKQEKAKGNGIKDFIALFQSSKVHYQDMQRHPHWHRALLRESALSQKSKQSIRELKTLDGNPIPILWQRMHQAYYRYCINTSVEITHRWQWICLTGDTRLINAALKKKLITQKTQDEDGMTPLHLLALCGFEEIFNTLVTQKQFDMRVVDSTENSVLHYALLGGHEQIAKRFSLKQDIPNKVLDLMSRAREKDTSGWTEAMNIFQHGTEASQLAYINARGKTLQQSLALQNKAGWSEAMLVFCYATDASQLAYIKARDKTLQQSLDLQNKDGRSEAMFIFRYGTQTGQLAYINTRGKTLHKSLDLQNKNGWTEAMLVFRYASKASQLAYIEARGKTLQQSLDLQSNDGWSEAMLIFRTLSGDSQLAYIEMRGKTLLQSLALQNKDGWSEAMVVFCYASGTTQLAYINARDKTLQQSSDLQSKNGFTEGAIALIYLSKHGVKTYLNLLNASLTQTILKNCYVNFSQIVSQALLFDVPYSSFNNAIHNFGICVSIIGDKIKLLNVLTDYKKAGCDSKGAVVLGMTINGNPITRETPGFSQAITTIEKLKTAIKAREGKVAWDEFGYLIKHCQRLKTVKAHAQDKKALLILEAVLEVLTPLEAYSTKALYRSSGVLTPEKKRKLTSANDKEDPSDLNSNNVTL